MVNFKEAVPIQISDASYPNGHLDHPDFIPWGHGWNFPSSAVSVDLLKSSLIHITNFYPTSAIIAVISSSPSEVFLVTTLIFLGGWGGGWHSWRIFPGVEYTYPLPSLPFVNGDNLILTSVPTQLCLISFSVNPEEVIPEDLGSAVDNSEVEQWQFPWYTHLCVSVC